MMYGMGKEILSGLAIVGGTLAIIAGAEAALPFVAGVGAFAALSGGVYQAATAPRRMNVGNSTRVSEGENRKTKSYVTME